MTKSFRELQLLGESKRFKQQSLELISQLSQSSLCLSTLERLENQIATDPFWLMKFKSQNFHIQAFEALASNENLECFCDAAFPLAYCLTSEELQEDSPCYSGFIRLIWALMGRKSDGENKDLDEICVQKRTLQKNALQNRNKKQRLVQNVSDSAKDELLNIVSPNPSFFDSIEKAIQLATTIQVLPSDLASFLMRIPSISQNFKLLCLKHSFTPTSELFSRLLKEFSSCSLTQQILCNFTANGCSFISPSEHFHLLMEEFQRVEEPTTSPLQFAFFINVLEHCALFRERILANESALLKRLFELTKKETFSRFLIGILLCCFCWEPEFKIDVFFGCSKEHFLKLIQEFIQLSIASGNGKIFHSASLASLLDLLKEQ